MVACSGCMAADRRHDQVLELTSRTIADHQVRDIQPTRDAYGYRMHQPFACPSPLQGRGHIRQAAATRRSRTSGPLGVVGDQSYDQTARLELLSGVLAVIARIRRADPTHQLIKRIIEQMARMEVEEVVRLADIGEAMTDIAGTGLVQYPRLQ